MFTKTFYFCIFYIFIKIFNSPKLLYLNLKQFMVTHLRLLRINVSGSHYDVLEAPGMLENEVGFKM
jgi:hypothetical protein